VKQLSYQVLGYVKKVTKPPHGKDFNKVFQKQSKPL